MYKRRRDDVEDALQEAFRPERPTKLGRPTTESDEPVILTAAATEQIAEKIAEKMADMDTTTDRAHSTEAASWKDLSDKKKDKMSAMLKVARQGARIPASDLDRNFTDSEKKLFYKLKSREQRRKSGYQTAKYGRERAQQLYREAKGDDNVKVSFLSQCFMQIYGSPFTKPSELAGGRALVPDPACRRDTASAYLYQYFNLYANADGKVTLATYSNPLMPLPFIPMGNIKAAVPIPTPGAASPMDEWIKTLDELNCENLFCQIDSLRRESMKMRPVGHGAKIWVSQQAGGATSGVIEAAQVQNGQTPDLSTRTSNTGFQHTLGFSDYALQGASLDQLNEVLNQKQLDNLQQIRDAEQGVTIRWTDPDKFDMIDLSSTAQLFIVTDQAADAFYGIYNGVTIYVRKPTTDINGNPYTGKLAWLSNHRSTDATPWVIMTTSGLSYSGAPCGASQASASAYSKEVVCDAQVTGLAPGQQCTVQMVWHIEYVPNPCSTAAATPSYVDPGFDSIILPLLADRSAFPIVVKGHSFFKSLKQALKKATGFMGKLMVGASQILSHHPDPRFQAAGLGAGFIGGAMEASVS
jgi:hypothetical protein